LRDTWLESWKEVAFRVHELDAEYMFKLYVQPFVSQEKCYNSGQEFKLGSGGGEVLLTSGSR